jgi:glycosyltransferase involved in cell wall biosynthesis
MKPEFWQHERADPRVHWHQTPGLEPPTISIVCPFYNEQEMVPIFFARLLPILDRIGERYEIVCVNDGSSDATLASLQEFRIGHLESVRIVDLSRNFGKEAALTAGIDCARGAAVIPIDADLQDPPELIAPMLAKWREGYDAVLARRVDRSADHALKALTASLFYRIHNRMTDTRIEENVGDFRLMSRDVVEALRRLPERQRFMKGLFAWIGFRTAVIDYVREKRPAGKTKFTGWRLWNLALEGITSFSTVPLRIWSYIGGCVALVSLLYGAYIAVRTAALGIDVPGYASLFVAVTFLGGLQLIGLGVLGEYLGRVYAESKQRPIYIVRKIHE